MAPPSKREWKKNLVTEPKFNDDVYEALNAALASYKTDPPHDRYNDIRLVAREILVNIYQHNKSVLIIGLEAEVTVDHEARVKIYHDGAFFDPFDPVNKCKLLLALDYDYKFNSKFVPTDSGRYRMELRMDLSMILGGAKK